MTIKQLLQDNFIGKKIRLYIREFRWINGMNNNRIEPPELVFDRYHIVHNWQPVTPNLSEDKITAISDKIVEIKKIRGKWVLQTLKGYEVILFDYYNVEIID